MQNERPTSSPFASQLIADRGDAPGARGAVAADLAAGANSCQLAEASYGLRGPAPQPSSRRRSADAAYSMSLALGVVDFAERYLAVLGYLLLLAPLLVALEGL